MKNNRLFWLLGAALLLLIPLGLYFFPSKHTSAFKGPVTISDPLPPKLVSEFEKYVKSTMRRYDVPGLSMVLVHGSDVVFAKGFGVRDLETKEPVTADTLMGIGSTTKSMTAVMVASLVDAGTLRWDTLAVDILPGFALSDAKITQQLTIEHTLCMCSGVPERMEEITFQYAELSAEDMIESLAGIPLNGRLGSKFNYSTQMLSVGGYLAALASGGEYGDLWNAYARVMQTQILDPLEMTASTFSLQAAAASSNVATPYYSGIAGFHAIPLDVEGVFTPIAPGGGLLSTANDMSKYLVMLLNHGTAANGTQVVSAENLAYLWEPRVRHDANLDYGLGWEIENYHGLTIYHHPGGTVGYAAELVVIPELNIGFALLTNRVDLVTPVGRLAYYRLLEMLTGREQVYDAEISSYKREIDQQLLTLSLVTAKTVDPEKVRPFLGSYQNEILGDVRLVLHEDKTLWLDVGEYDIPLRPLRLEENQYIFYESTFLGKNLIMNAAANGKTTMTVTGNEGKTYRFELVAAEGSP